MTARRRYELGELPDLADGEMTRACAEDGTAILICRVKGELYGLSDQCSHAEASLSEGRLRGYLITCPRHSAAFDVRTGAHMGPPAARPIAAFSVDVQPMSGTVVEERL